MINRIKELEEKYQEKCHEIRKDIEKELHNLLDNGNLIKELNEKYSGKYLRLENTYFIPKDFVISWNDYDYTGELQMEANVIRGYTHNKGINKCIIKIKDDVLINITDIDLIEEITREEYYLPIDSFYTSLGNYIEILFEYDENFYTEKIYLDEVEKTSTKWYKKVKDLEISGYINAGRITVEGLKVMKNKERVYNIRYRKSWNKDRVFRKP